MDELGLKEVAPMEIDKKEGKEEDLGVGRKALSPATVDDLYVRMKELQRQLEFVDIQVIFPRKSFYLVIV
tara:strand:- start:1380 stop:1589 length:210 start_codon:yes stop_codon:yes gene_type:complete